MKRLLLVVVMIVGALHSLHAQRAGHLFPVRQNNLWGYIDDSGTVVIPLQYDFAEAFSGDYAVVAKQKKRYAINRKGEIVTPHGFDWLNLISDSLLTVREGKKWGLVRLDGSVLLPSQYDAVERVSKTLVGFRNDTLWGYCTTGGKILIGPRCDTAWLLHNRYLRYESGGKTGLVKLDGTPVLDAVCDDIKLEGSIVFYRTGANWGCRKIAPVADVFPPVWNSWELLTWRLIKVMNDSSVALYDASNGLLFDTGRYDNFASMRPDRVLLIKDSLYGLTDTVGRIIMPCAFSEIAWNEEDRWAAQTGGSWQLYDNAGRKISDRKYDWIGPFKAHLALIGSKGKRGLINCFGTEIVPPTTDEINTNDPQHVKVTNAAKAVTIIELDENGRLIDRNSYAELHTITIGQRSNSGTLAPSAGVTNLATGVDSLSSDTLVWFLSVRNNRWGLKNRITNDTLIKPMFTSVADYRAQHVTLVEVSVASKGPTISGKTWLFDSRFGLVDSRTGKYIIPVRFTDINMSDYINKPFSDLVRAINSEGQNGLVSTDGRARFSSYLYIDDPVNGVARVCLRGRWVLNAKNQKEAVMNMQSFAALFTRDLSKWAAKNDVFLLSRKRLTIEDAQWALITKSGVLLGFDEKRNIYRSYDYMKPIEGNNCIVREGLRWGTINMSGDPVLAPAFYKIDYLKGSEAGLLEAASYDERYGYFNTLGEVAVKPDIERSRPISENLIPVKSKGRWGFCDTIGQWVIDPVWFDARPFSEGLAAMKKKGRWGFIDHHGSETIEAAYESVGDFSGGMAWVKKKGRTGFIDAGGTLVIETKFRNAGNFSGGAAPAREKRRWGLIDASGKWIHKPAWRTLQPYSNGVFLAARGRHYRLVDATGKPTCKNRIDRVAASGEGLSAVRVHGKWGYTDSLGAMAIEPEFDAAQAFSEGLAAVRVNGRFGYCDRSGRMVIEPAFSKAGAFSCGLAYVRRRDTTGYIDRSGKLRFAVVSPGAGPFRENKAVVHDWQGHAYFIDANGQPLFGKTFNDAQEFQHGFAAVKIDDLWGVIDSTGMLVVSPHLAVVDDYQSGFARFKQTAFYGVYDTKAREIVKPICDRVEQVAPHLYRVESGAELGYLDDKGAWIWNLQR